MRAPAARSVSAGGARRGAAGAGVRRGRAAPPRAVRDVALENEPESELENGRCVSGPDLSVEVDGLKMPNPFVIGSGPPGTNKAVMRKAFQEGWGGVIAKTISLDAAVVKNVTPRYAKLRSWDNKQVIGWENIELISDRPTETMLREFKELKEEFPDRILIASIMEEYKEENWKELIKRCEDAGVDAFEINFSYPHGMPERKMGAAMGQDCEVLEDVCGWINETATKPVWAKMTPNITDITAPASVALDAGLEGVAAINTIQSVMGVNLKTLRPEPSVEGYTTPGGYSSVAVKPIALAKVMKIAQMIKRCAPSGGPRAPPTPRSGRAGLTALPLATAPQRL